MTRISILFAVVSLFFAAITVNAQAQQKFEFYDRGAYRSEVPKPQEILRFDVGEQHTTYAQMEMVIEAIAEKASDRVKIFDIGLTNENRMQHIVAISSPENMRRLDEIKSNNAKLFDPRTTSPSEASRIAAENPLIAWMAYTIHGNESASFETFMQVIYQLAASNEPATMEILKNTVVLIVTGENPDGHERFATWYNSVAVGDPNPLAFEHREPWSVWGRFNRYRFDLNRDNISITQKETENMVKAFFEWNPQVAVDHHGQPSQFFFPPAALPINPNLPQPVTNKWLDIFGRANGKAFDDQKWDYYVRDIFDLFYAGYWDSMPSLNGATGMTYETDGGGFKGLKWRRNDGTFVTLRSAIAKHYVASMTTLETAARNRQARINDFYSFRSDAMKKARTQELKRIIIDPTRSPLKAAELAETLLKTNIEVFKTTSQVTAGSARTYMEKNASPQSKTFPAGSYVIDVNQPQAVWIKGLLEQDTPQDPEFVADNMARFKRNQLRGANVRKEGYGFYDLTAWNPPLAYGLDAYWTSSPDNWTRNLTRVTNQNLKDLKQSESGFRRAKIAYLIPYKTDAAPAMAIRLMQKGFIVNVATRPLNTKANLNGTSSRDWKPGTFVVRVTRNPETVHNAVQKLSAEMGVQTIALDTAYTEKGDTGVGGSNVVPLNQPKVLVVSDPAVRQTSFGSIWWTLDKFGIKFTPMTFQSMSFGGMDGYDVVIIPDGSPGRIRSALGTGGLSRLKSWIRGGGTLITMRGSSVFATLKGVDLTTATMVGSDGSAKPQKITAPEKMTNEGVRSTDEPDKAIDIPTLPPIVSPSANRNKVPEGIPGAIMRATVDQTTYLNYGVDRKEIPVLVASGYFFNYSKRGSNALVFEESPKKPLTISGFVWEGNTEPLLAGTSYLIDERQGRGHVIMFAEDVFFRGIFRSTTRQFMNAIAFNGSF